MLTVSPGAPATFTLPVIDDNGDPVTATNLSYEVIDAVGVRVHGPINIVEFDVTDAEIKIPGSVNVLPGRERRAGYEVVLTIQTADGEFQQGEVYQVQARLLLVPLENSFLTYTGAVVEAQGVTDKANWDLATPAQRQNALEEAYRRITRLGFAFDCRDYAPGYFGVREFETAPEDVSKLPARFRAALMRAQVIEANHILGQDDPFNQKRRAGVMLDKVGESSMMFSQAKPLEEALSRPAMRELGRWINRGVAITRA